jgi:hypothetical protein
MGLHNLAAYYLQINKTQCVAIASTKSYGQLLFRLLQLRGFEVLLVVSTKEGKSSNENRCSRSTTDAKTIFFRLANGVFLPSEKYFSPRKTIGNKVVLAQ